MASSLVIHEKKRKRHLWMQCREAPARYSNSKEYHKGDHTTTEADPECFLKRGLARLSLIVPVFSWDRELNTGEAVRWFGILDLDLPKEGMEQVKQGRQALFRSKSPRSFEDMNQIKQWMSQEWNRRRLSMKEDLRLYHLVEECTLFEEAMYMTAHIAARLSVYRRESRPLVFFTGLRGFRILIHPEEPLWYRIRQEQKYGPAFGAAARQYWIDQVHCDADVYERLDHSIHHFRHGIKPDVVPHPDSKWWPQQVRVSSSTTTVAEEEALWIQALRQIPITLDRPDTQLIQTLTRYWQQVADQCPLYKESARANLPLLKGPLGKTLAPSLSSSSSSLSSSSSPSSTITSMQSNQILTYYNHYFPWKNIWKWLTQDGQRSAGWIVSGRKQNSEEGWWRDTSLKCSALKSDTEWRQRCLDNRDLIDLNTGFELPKHLASTMPLPLRFDVDVSDWRPIQQRPCLTCTDRTVCELCWCYVWGTMLWIHHQCRVTGHPPPIWFFSGSRGAHGWCIQREIPPKVHASTIVHAWIPSASSLVSPTPSLYTCLWPVWMARLVGWSRQEILPIPDAFRTACLDESAVETKKRIHGWIQQWEIEKRPHLASWNIHTWVCSSSSSSSRSMLARKWMQCVVEAVAPRIDAGVTQDDLHLLRIPLSIHPKSLSIVWPLSASFVALDAWIDRCQQDAYYQQASLSEWRQAWVEPVIAGLSQSRISIPAILKGEIYMPTFPSFSTPSSLCRSKKSRSLPSPEPLTPTPAASRSLLLFSSSSPSL